MQSKLYLHRWNNPSELRLFIRQLMALAFLPEGDIPIYYAELKQQEPSSVPQLENVLSYFEST